jgi:hypothetical protein
MFVLPVRAQQPPPSAIRQIGRPLPTVVSGFSHLWAF